MKPKKLIACLLFLLTIVSMAVAKNGKEHTKDMLRVLGFYSEHEPKKSGKNWNIMKPITSLFNEMIDDTQSISSDETNLDFNADYQGFRPSNYYHRGDNQAFYQQLKAKYPGFSYGFPNDDYGHRLMFHWGLEDDPTNTSALKEAFLRRCNISSGDESEERLNDFLNDIRTEQMDRSATMRKAIDDFFSLGGSRESDRGLAGLLYYVHLLGDHISHSDSNKRTAEAILPIQTIAANLDKYVKDLTKHGNQSEYQIYKEKIRAIVYSSDEQYATSILRTLSESVPKILQRNYGNTLAAKGLHFLDYDDAYN